MLRAHFSCSPPLSRYKEDENKMNNKPGEYGVVVVGGVVVPVNRVVVPVFRVVVVAGRGVVDVQAPGTAKQNRQFMP